MAKRSSLMMRLEVDGINDTLKKLRGLPKDANDKLKDASNAIAKKVAASAKQAGRTDRAPQSALVASTVKAARDRVPVVTAGGSKKLGRHRVPAHALLFASEFGMDQRSGWYAKPKYRNSTGRQYPPNTGRKGHWFFPTVEREQTMIAREWREAADAVIDEFSAGG